jgi:predicted methyltransferase
VDFASPKGGGVVYNLYLKQSLPSGTNMADLLAEMEKKYGSPTDTQQTNDVADDSGTITATWGMTIADSSLDASPQSGKVLKIELDNVDGEGVTVSFFLKDFTVEAADEQARKAFLAQAAAQQASQANKALNY